MKTRLRRLRTSPALRNIIKETRISINELIYPLFVVPGSDINKEIPSMPNCFHYSIDNLCKEAASVKEMGINAVILFGIPESKDIFASHAYREDGIIHKTIRAIKKKVPELLVITDVCLCEYTSHGHCGIVENGKIINDKSVELIAKTALSHAEAGADIVAPSDMMDGRVSSIRSTLDNSGYEDVLIMSYAAKYSSAFYGPFRDAVDSAPSFGDRKTYQMDFSNSREALREVRQDIEEGADIVMVKPALSYLDIIKQVKSNTLLPVSAYNVSGEYAMVKAAARNGWIDEKAAVEEILTSIKRAGADMIITYHAKDAVKFFNT